MAKKALFIGLCLFFIMILTELISRNTINLTTLLGMLTVCTIISLVIYASLKYKQTKDK
ncbi:putative membrane protein [Geomicrobium sediminis]|uniref:Membrane protein n=1 Tax=Geomicrobium sediminis TaxID=1347788 RepID=A0ABS2PAJ5_9BACL|nr:putative membrane protein [Geomicrobium sediminis]